MIFDEKHSLCEKTQAIIVSSENGKEHRANNVNKDTVYQFKIDGDILPSGTAPLRCDYIVENETKHSAYLIELKGSDIEHATDQIRSTHQAFLHVLQNYKLFPRIVGRSNTHSLRSSKVRKFKQDYQYARIENSRIAENI